jgi:hypothetical protein
MYGVAKQPLPSSVRMVGHYGYFDLVHVFK